jgi:hypothetical protein
VSTSTTGNTKTDQLWSGTKNFTNEKIQGSIETRH